MLPGNRRVPSRSPPGPVCPGADATRAGLVFSPSPTLGPTTTIAPPTRQRDPGRTMQGAIRVASLRPASALPRWRPRFRLAMATALVQVPE